MSAIRYTLINRDDPSIDSFHNVFFKIRLALGTTAFGINEVRLPAGMEGIEHDEFARSRVEATAQELLEERAAVEELLA